LQTVDAGRNARRWTPRWEYGAAGAIEQMATSSYTRRTTKVLYVETPSLAPAGGPGRNFDCAGLRNRRGRDHACVAVMRVVARTQVVKENAGHTDDRDNDGYYHWYRVTACAFFLREDLHVLLNSLLDVREELSSQSAVTIKFNFTSCVLISTRTQRHEVGIVKLLEVEAAPARGPALPCSAHERGTIRASTPCPPVAGIQEGLIVWCWRQRIRKRKRKYSAANSANRRPSAGANRTSVALP
jgi:hypothetical protein